MTGQQPGPRIVPPEVRARDGVDGHDCIRVEAYVTLSDRARVLGEQREAVLALHRSLNGVCGECDGWPDWPCPTARALGLTE